MTPHVQAPYWALPLVLLLVSGCASMKSTDLRWNGPTDCTDSTTRAVDQTSGVSATVCRGLARGKVFVGIVENCECVAGPNTKSSFYQTLDGAGPYRWSDVRPGEDVPEAAVSYGAPVDGRRRVICRMSVNGTMMIGYAESRLNPSDSCDCVALNSTGTHRTEFAVLTGTIDDKPFPFDRIAAVNHRRNILIVRNGDSCGFYSSTGHEILPCEYVFEPYFDGPYAYADDRGIVAQHDNRWGTLGTDGSILIPFEYTYLVGWHGQFYGQKSGNVFQFDSAGAVPTSLPYRFVLGVTDITEIRDDKFVRDAVVFVSANGSDVDTIHTTGSSHAEIRQPVVLRVDGRYGLYDPANHSWRVPAEYDRIENRGDHFDAVRDGVTTRIDR